MTSTFEQETLPTADRYVLARYAGSTPRSGPLTLGQRNMLRCVLRDDPWHLTVGMVWDLPPDTSHAHVTDLVGILLSRHESLRTTYVNGDEPIQVVSGEGELPIGVWETTGDPVAFGEDLARRMRAVRFQLESELQIRISLITQAEAPSQVVFVVGHLAADGRGLEIVTKEWADLVAGRQLPPVTTLCPVDVAEQEHSPAGQRRALASLRHWDTQLRRIPRNMFAVAGVGATDWLLPRLRVQSRRAAEALEAIAARTRSSHSSVFLAALSALAGHRAGQNIAAVTMLSANRFQPELRNYVGTIAQDALMSVDLTGWTFDDLVKRTSSASFAAFQHSRFDSTALWDIIHGTGRLRGTHFDRDCVFSDISALEIDDIAFLEMGVAAPGQGTRILDDGDVRLTWMPPVPMPASLCVWTHQLQHEIDLSLWSDPQCLSVEEAEQFAHGLLKLLIAARDGNPDQTEIEQITGVVPVPRGTGWFRIDSCWVDIAAVRDLIGEIVGDRPFHIDAVPDERMGHRLECHVADDTGLLTLEGLHEQCIQALPRHVTAITPHHYRVCERPPTASATWQNTPARAEGNGRPAGLAEALQQRLGR